VEHGAYFLNLYYPLICLRTQRAGMTGRPRSPREPVEHSDLVSRFAADAVESSDDGQEEFLLDGARPDEAEPLAKGGLSLEAKGELSLEAREGARRMPPPQLDSLPGGMFGSAGVPTRPAGYTGDGSRAHSGTPAAASRQLHSLTRTPPPPPSASVGRPAHPEEAAASSPQAESDDDDAVSVFSLGAEREPGAGTRHAAAAAVTAQVGYPQAVSAAGVGCPHAVSAAGVGCPHAVSAAGVGCPHARESAAGRPPRACKQASYARAGPSERKGIIETGECVSEEGSHSSPPRDVLLGHASVQNAVSNRRALNQLI
jgi:hypothetical protein